MKRYLIGVDIGGTNTDVVLVAEAGQIIAARKEFTSKPLEQAVSNAIYELLLESEVVTEQIDAVFFGTTHATNAILEVKDLLGVGLIRVAGHQPDSTPCFFWPQALRNVVLKAYETIDGGFECHGAPITEFDENQAKMAIKRLLAKDVSAISIVGVFSPINAAHENRCAELVKEIAGDDFPVTVSHMIGGMGFLERENASLLNSSLKKVIADGFSALDGSMRSMQITAPLYMVQNDGSIMDLKQAMNMPILTIAAGQTNSFIGGCKVAGLDRAIVVDVGGTSTDIGSVTNGVPRRSCHATHIGGVELHFAMPDVLSLALGGGSIVTKDAIGPQSVARRLKQEAQCFGGSTLTLTDVAVLLDIVHIPDASKKNVSLSVDDAEAILQQVQQKVVQSLHVAMGKDKDLPIVLVGGGAPIIAAALLGTALASKIIVPQLAAVANAYGAALAEISATIQIVAPLASGREELLEKLKMKTRQEAVQKGADSKKTRIANVDIIPYAYSKDGLAKVSVTALGPRR